MRFEEVYDRWTERRLTQQEAADLLNVSERQFRRQCRRYESDGLEVDRSAARAGIGTPSAGR